MSIAELLTSARADSPWLLFVAAVLFAAAAAAARRIAGTLRRLGARVGTLEQRSQLERVRRYQLEAAVRREGIPLAPWPDDPPPEPLAPVDEDQDDEDDLTRGLPAVPAYTPAERARFAQHRR